MEDLTHLADLIRIRNFVNSSVSKIIRGPAESGRIAEYVASQIFDIKLAEIFVEKAIDGYFEPSSPLAGQSVNVKFRSSSSRRLNLIDSGDLAHHPRYYLAFRGPTIPKSLGHEKMLPFVIEVVYLFSAPDLIAAMQAEGEIKFGPAIKKQYWDRAKIYPQQVNEDLILTDEQRAALALFAPS